MILAVAFDFGGVLAEEGFREGLAAIGRMNGKSPQEFVHTAGELAYRTGYVTGDATEEDYWSAVRRETGISQGDHELRGEILGRFMLRPGMLHLVQRVRASGYLTVVLSDQTNWLDEINDTFPFFHFFDAVFNSFHIKKSKKDQDVFWYVCAELGLRPEEIIFIDDNEENIHRAARAGVEAIHFKSITDIMDVMSRLIHVH